MKCLLVDVNEVVKDGITTCWCSLVKLPKETNKGSLYHHKKADMFNMYPVDKLKNPELYARISVLRPGTLLDLEYAVNDFGKAVLKDIKVIKPSPFTYDELFK